MCVKQPTKFDICYALGKTLALDPIDFRSENLSWYRFKDKQKKYVLIKSVKTFDNSISFNSYQKLFHNISCLIIISEENLDNYLKIDLESTQEQNCVKGTLKVKKEEVYFYPLSLKISPLTYTKTSIKLNILNMKETVGRYKDILKRNYIQTLNYLLYKVVFDFNEHILIDRWEKSQKSTISKADKEVYKLAYKDMSMIRIRNACFGILKSKDMISKLIVTTPDGRELSYEEQYYEIYQKNILKFSEFDSFWNDNKPRKCSYCGISEEQIALLNNHNSIKTKRFYSRGTTMEIDKKDPFGEYRYSNIILSCYWCNNAKTDEYSIEEFEAIAKGINEVWNKRLSLIDKNKIIQFPPATYI